jgi:3-deoxy-D-manno-octulosonic acid (KDO) 8-phosphate synthase
VAAIVTRGIDVKRLNAVGHGQDKPIADNSTNEGKAKNRRVELVKKLGGIGMRHFIFSLAALMTIFTSFAPVHADERHGIQVYGGLRRSSSGLTCTARRRQR